MYVENKNNKLEEAIKFILSETPASGDYYALVTRTILQELLNFNPKDTMMSDRDTYRENIKEAIEKIRRGLDFISLTKDSVYDISNLSELSSYLLSVAITGKGYAEKTKYEDTNYIEPLNKLVRDYYINPQIQALYSNANTWIHKGDSIFNQGKYEEAIACYDKAIEMGFNYAYVWHNKGHALFNQGKYEEAIACYDKAIELDPNFIYAWNNKGNTLHKLGRDTEAIACYDKAIEINENYVDVWRNKGVVLSAQGKYEEAIACYDKAIEIDPNNAIAWNNKGLALQALGRDKEAQECFDKARKLGLSLD